MRSGDDLPRQSGDAAAPGPEERTQSRFADLLEVATELFSTHGYDGTSVRVIADRMGIKSGSLYSHISSKEDLLFEIVSSMAREIYERGIRAASEGTPEERLRALCRSHIGLYQAYPAGVSVYVAEWRKVSSEQRDTIITLRERYEALFTSVIQAGIDDGAFGRLDVRSAVFMLLSMLNGAYQWYSPKGPLGADQLADRLVEIALSGLRNRDP